MRQHPSRESSLIGNSLLAEQVLVEDAATVKAELIAASRDSEGPTEWPSVALGRSFNELLERTEILREEEELKERKKLEAAARREAAKHEQERQRRMKQMVKAPT